MKQVSLGATGKVLGGKYPLACVPIVAPSPEAALNQAFAIHNSQIAPDVVELRADFLPPIDSMVLTALLQQINSLLGPSIPLLFTNRHPNEGGANHWDDVARVKSYFTAMDCSAVSAIDIELATDTMIRRAMIQQAQISDVTVIISTHNFVTTPDLDTLALLLKMLTQGGGHVSKLAATPTTPSDALHILEATLVASKEIDIPLVTMGMGNFGMITRLAGPLYGSAMSFATVDQSSAPGQPTLRLLRDYWREAGIR